MGKTESGKAMKIAGIVADVVTVAVFLLCLSIAFVCLSLKTAISPFGVSVGVVQSPSMEASGIYAGDFMFIKHKKAYVKGDIIAFYRAPSLYGERAENADLTGAQVWVHEIIDVKTDALGRQTYLTKGSSNLFDDGAYVPEDFVLGRARKMPGFISSFLGFACTRTGIILLVIVPCGLLLLYLTFILVSELTAKDEQESLQDSAASAADTGSFIVRRKTFYAKMCLATEEIKRMYSVVANALLSYKGVRRRRSRKCDTFRAFGNRLSAVSIRGKKLCADFYPQNLPEENTGENVEEAVQRIRITGRVTLGKALNCVRECAEARGLSKNLRYKEVDFASEFPALTEQMLVEMGQVRLSEADFGWRLKPETAEAADVDINEETSDIADNFPVETGVDAEEPADGQTVTEAEISIGESGEAGAETGTEKV